MRVTYRGRVVLWVALWAALGLAARTVRAQTPAPVVVRVAPASLQLAAGQIVDVAVEVVDVQELYAFDVTVVFDGQVVEVVDADPNVAGVQMSQGLFLDPGFAVINAADNAAGRAHLVMTQLNPSVAKSGTGALIVLRLRGKEAGRSTALALPEPMLARRDGGMIAATGVAGRVEVVSAAVPASTPMPTQGAGTPMAALTPEPTSVPATATSVPTAGLPTFTSIPVPPTVGAVASATARVVPSHTPVAAASPVVMATATAGPASATSPSVVSATPTSRPSSTVAAVPSATAVTAATVGIQAPSPEASAASGAGRTGSSVLFVAGLVLASALVAALWLRSRRAASG